MAKIRIIFTSNTSFSLYNFRLGLMRVLKQKNYEIIAMAPVDEYTHLLESEFIFFPIRHLDRKGKNPFKEVTLFLEYLRYYKTLKPNLVLSYTIKPNIYSALTCGILKIPSICVVTGLGSSYQEKTWLKYFIKILYKLTLKFSKKVIVQNPEDREIFTRILPPQKVVLIKSSGVNVDFFSRKECNGRWTTNKNKTIFLFFGRFLIEKGIRELIEAGEKLWRDYKNFEIWLMGKIDEGNPNSLKQKDLKEIEKFEFLKIIPFTKDVRKFLCEADVVVYPSYYREGIPRALLEAMAMEKPIITTDTPGCREVVIHQKTGFLVKPQDATSLFQAMKIFLEMPREEREDMGKKGRELCLQEFDEKIIVEKYLKIIEETLSSKFS